LPQATDVSAIELECQPGKMGEVFIVRFKRVDFGPLDAAVGDDVSEFVVEAFDQVIVRPAMQAEHEFSANVAHAVVHAVKSHDLLNGGLDIVGHFQQREIRRRDQLLIE